MIRMGGSRSEPSNKTNYSPQTSENAASYQYSGQPAVQSESKAITDSDAMARDIKEGRLSGFVGHGTVLTGETNFQAMLRVDGHLIGTVASDTGTLLVGTNGQVDANIMVTAAMINGTVNGDILASEKIQLGRTAKVVGNIQTPRLLIEDGAVFEGSCSMLKSREIVENQISEAEATYKVAEIARYETQNVAENDVDDHISEDDEDEIAEAATV